MARARIKQLQTPRIITLELTEGEADFVLGLVAGFCAGHPRKSPRKYAVRIQAALLAISGYGVRDTDSWKLGEGKVQFHPYGSDQGRGSRNARAARAQVLANPVKRARKVETLRVEVLESEDTPRGGRTRRG